jgi:hypothetical protein
MNSTATERRILLCHAQAGMVLARTVESPTRTRLCPSGATLNDQLINRLAARGIKRLWIVGIPDPGQAAMAWGETSKRLHERFSRVKHQPYLVAIQRLIENALAKRS